jgi:RNase P subunit RPR2
LKILDEIPAQLRGRGHNECVPVECHKCSTNFLFGLSDGTRKDGKLDDETKSVKVKCPACNEFSHIPPSQLTPHNGQAR